ncbi:hypothetical protein NMY22_g7502 [Coprinellus aureogranulatus]|nr:hypothetical protein NMY22_g7502 [Coprinellus aureogranulatus]
MLDSVLRAPTLLNTLGKLLEKLISNRATSASMNFSSLRQSTPFDSGAAKSSTAHNQPVWLEAISLMKIIGGPTTSSPNLPEQEFAVAFSYNDIREWLNSPDSNAVFGVAWLKLQHAHVQRLGDPVWHLPGRAKKEKDLYRLFLAIIQAIIDEFVLPSLGNGEEREVIDSHKMGLTHKDGKRHTSPDLVVRATGSSFEISRDGKRVGYSCIIALFDVKLQRRMSMSAYMRQMAIYARQIFAHQPNRIFVRGMVLCETYFQLVHFDRSGAQVSPPISLNEGAVEFVRCVIELCGRDDGRSGFDDSIQWEIVDGEKSGGTMTFGEPGNERTFDLVSPQPIAHSIDIRGDATTLWAVTEISTGKSFTVKDSWASDGRTPEHELLFKAKGQITGVAEIVDFQLRDITTEQFRCNSTIGEFICRQAIRTVLEPLGMEIHNFKSVPQVLRAIRDAVQGHFGLYGLNILHRDISNRRILLGNDGAAEGWRGALIDLGSALDFDASKKDLNLFKEARLGTRFFQSTTTLTYLSHPNPRAAPPHDYLDDLEGIFLLTCFLVFQYHPDGAERKKDDEARSVVAGWDSENAEISLGLKLLVMDPKSEKHRKATDIVARSWGSACARLFSSFCAWAWEISEKKKEIIHEARSQDTESGSDPDSAKEPGTDNGYEDIEMDSDEARSTRILPAEEYQRMVGHEGGSESEEDKDSDDSDSDSDSDDEDEDEFPEEPDFEGLFSPKTVVIPQVPSAQGIFAPLMNDSSKHYLDILNLFDTAIAAIEQSPQEAGPPHSAPKKTTRSKRMSPGSSSSAPKAKKAKVRAPVKEKNAAKAKVSQNRKKAMKAKGARKTSSGRRGQRADEE